MAGEMERLRWLAGAYYFDNEVNGNYTLNTDAIGFVRMDARYTQQTDSIDLFGQVEYDLADSLDPDRGPALDQRGQGAGFPRTSTTPASPPSAAPSPTRQAEGCFNPAPTPISPYRPTPDYMILFNTSTVGGLAKQDDSYVTGRLQLNWSVTDDMLLYGSYSRGKKSAGFNNGFLDTTQVFGNNPIESIPVRLGDAGRLRDRHEVHGAVRHHPPERVAASTTTTRTSRPSSG